MKVLVTGAAGQLGQAMVRHLAADHQVTAWTRDTIDLTSHREVRDMVLRLAPAAIINCASYNNVDQAEDQQETALDVNAFVVRTLARAAAELDALLMHYSTDFVFSGTAAAPYTELDRPEPQSVVRAVEAGRRVDGGRRAEALCAAGGEPVWRAPHAQQHGSHCRRRAGGHSRRRSLSIGWSRPASSPTSSAPRPT